MTKLRCGLAAVLLAALFTCCGPGQPGTARIGSEVMRDKIRGGWVGQTVACTYGGPTEFDWNGTWIQDYVPIEWDETRLSWYYENSPGLYDDLYMDLAFLAVLDSLGLDAPVEAMAHKFATAGFQLWHANQAARWNILNGIMPPQSGYWKNNPHADDIDFQIESDFIGLICPGMPATALGYADKVGHIMNYGDGVYGGVFVSAMYSHAFVETDIVAVVEKALLSLPPQSKYARCIGDVVGWWRQYPDDWHRTWFEVQKKWSEDVGCPGCTLDPGDIDAAYNGAYIAIGLLYGGGDFGKTVDISTRCGADSDCNPANAGGILGTLLGFSRIPDRWKLGLDKVENLKFSYSNYSLEDACRVSYRLAAELVRRGGGEVTDDAWKIRLEPPKAPDKIEVGFEGLAPESKSFIGGGRWEPGHKLTPDNPYTGTFQGAAFVIDGRLEGYRGQAQCEVYVDGSLVEQVVLAVNLHDRRTPLFWSYDLEQGPHQVEVRMLGGDGVPVLTELLVYRKTGS
ncbi:MAG: ADP-ribosylglycohydrolase family protein [Candidatus Glassbacteria bacterium]|nr:ADP-ribosylglycohydrolase family protein [Candidatus Glassbacteria bacterium]